MLDGIDVKRVRCVVFDIQRVTADIDFVCSNAAFGGHATLAEQLDIVLVLKLVIEEQLDVALCPTHHKDTCHDHHHHDHHHHHDDDDHQRIDPIQ